MNWFERLHFLHRAWRYRLISEKFGISFLLSRDLTGKTAVDIGSNLGIYSYWIHAQVGKKGTVVAFEPQQELATYLKDLRDYFSLHRLQIAEMGLSSENGERVLQRPRTHWGGASFEDIGELHNDLDMITSRVTTLDDYFADHPARPISFIKCDVEGHEYHVFQGGRRVLLEDRPDLLFECHDAKNPKCRVFSYLTSLDYMGYCFYRGGFAPVSDYGSLRSSMHKKAMCDFVFVPKERSHTLTKR